MFNILLALMAGVIIGWTFHAFFTALDAPTIIQKNINLPTTDKTEINSSNISKNFTPVKVRNEIKKRVTNAQTIEEDSFYTLLNNGAFSDAMSLYLDAQSEKLPFYRSAILDYFKTKADTSLTTAQMLEYIDLEPSHHEQVAQLLIERYQKTKKYKEAIALTVELLQTSSKQEKLKSRLIQLSESYIKTLKDSKKTHRLKEFLEEQIALDILTPFYTYELATFYVDIQKYLLAIELLKEIEYDENYRERVKNLLELINQKIQENKIYAYKIPIKKEGDHFLVDVTVNNTPLTLLLDTGATITTINENRINSLKVIQENITLNTAGGEIIAQLKEAKSFSVGDIKLKEFQIISSSFKEEKSDGLLGMNFFKEFKFKIDQDEQMLYLSKK